MHNSPYLRRVDKHHNDWSDTVQTHTNARADGSPFIHATQHQYDILGNRIGATLPALGAAGQLNLLTYGSGHVHAVQLGGHTVIDFERDPLHQETERSFAGLHLTRELDPVGRLLSQRQEGQAVSPTPYLNAAYRYNGSGQLIEVERSASIDGTALHLEPQLTQYQYDRAERLSATVRIGNASSMQRHQFDGAGNRLPALIPEHHLAQRPAASTQNKNTGKDQRHTDWSDTVQAGLNDPNFNVLQNESSLGRGQRQPISQWRDNRVHYDGVYSYQYDASGNRIKRAHVDGSTDTYGYDGDHRLVHHCAMNDQGQISHTTENDYDALGRRIRRRVTTHAANSNNNSNATPVTQTTHYGWDGDRLVYVETEHNKTHTVYEPGSFVPLLRITQATHDQAGKAKQAKSDAMAMLGLSDNDQQSPDERGEDSEETPDWQAMNAGLSSAAKAPLPELAKQILRDMGMNPDDVHRDLKRQVKQQKAKTRQSLTVHLYHCNHLGTPVALVNEQGNIDWAIELDAWGNTVNEYHSNPSKPIEQPIRMQGQQLDKDSGLFYNRHRFYDPLLGRYVNQDPIGLQGGTNSSAYAGSNPLSRIDPLGLWAPAVHDQIISQSFPAMPPELLAKIQEGSRSVDALWNQLPGIGRDSDHAMRASGQSIADAKAQTCKMIKQNLEAYEKWKDSSNPMLSKFAYFRLGQAIHPVMDSTSPVHAGYQEWHLGDAGKHGPASLNPNSQESKISPHEMARNVALIKETLSGKPCACTF